MNFKEKDKVQTSCLGTGIIVGIESFRNGSTIRYLVKLDDPSKWSFGKEYDVAEFFESELFKLN